MRAKSMLAASLRAITFRSTAGISNRFFLNVSLTKRFTLFRVTAQPTFLLTVTPKRAYARLLSCQTTKIPFEATLWAEFFNLRNSDRFRSLRNDGNLQLARGGTPVKIYLTAIRTARFFLPFALLRFITRRPFFVAILTRKPCVLLRETLLGWNVLFMFIPLEIYFKKWVFNHNDQPLSR